MTVETLTEQRCHGGLVSGHRHCSTALGLPASFSVFRPAEALNGQQVPILFVLAGLTCTHETFLQKSGIISYAAGQGMMLVAPDTSPRGANVAGEDASYDLGTAASFYIDATQAPWSHHYQMGHYLSNELPELIRTHFNQTVCSMGIMGHSMGGHGALVHALRSPDLWSSVSALAPIVHPSIVPWGEKAFEAYLGSDRASWSEWDATALLRAGRVHESEILIDQGGADEFLARELRPELIEIAARKAVQPMTLRYQDGYDHSYWFIQSVIADHIAHHARILRALK